MFYNKAFKIRYCVKADTNWGIGNFRELFATRMR